MADNSPPFPSRHRRHIRQLTATTTSTPTNDYSDSYLYSFSYSSSTRDLAKKAEWRTWPTMLLSPLRVIHNLCDQPWINALSSAADSWASGVDAVSFKFEDGGCNSKVNDDLSYVDNTLHVVYGTCGAGCCGKTDVEYNYRYDSKGAVIITRYAALIRLDPDCFQSTNDNNEGRQYLVCHELGHALGLGHNYEGLSKSCLDSFEGDNFMPGYDDLDLLNYELYPMSQSKYVDEDEDEGDEGAMSASGKTSQPTASPTSIGISSDDDPGDSNVLTILSTKDCGKNECRHCQGDCDADSDCKGELRCFFRSGFKPVPGCQGEGVANKDYCYDPNGEYEATTTSRISGVGDVKILDLSSASFKEERGGDGGSSNKSPAAVAFIVLAAVLLVALLFSVYLIARRRRRRLSDFLSDSKHPVEPKATAHEDNSDEEDGDGVCLTF